MKSMRDFLIVSMLLLLALTACSAKQENIVFTAVIEEVQNSGLLVKTVDYDVFDSAFVGYGEGLELGFNLIVGQTLEITALPAIRETYPAHVTAVAIKLLGADQSADAEYREITPEEAKGMIDGGGVTILDVRTQEEYDEAHILDAVLLPDYDVEAQASEVLPDKDATILVYCRTGIRSEASARMLVDMGYSGVYDIGGIAEWPYETVTAEE